MIETSFSGVVWMPSRRFYIDLARIRLFQEISMPQVLKGRFDGSKIGHPGSAGARTFPAERTAIDDHGRRVLVGLTAAETREFETLDALSPSGGGRIGWTFGGEPTTGPEKRWLELYNRHAEALRRRRGGAPQ